MSTIYFKTGFSIKGIVGQPSLVDNTYCVSEEGYNFPPIALYHQAVSNCYFYTSVDAQNNTLLWIVPTDTEFSFKLGQNSTFTHINYAKPSLTRNDLKISYLKTYLNESATNIPGLLTSSHINQLSKVKPDNVAPHSLSEFIGYCHNVTIRDNLTSGAYCIRYKDNENQPFIDDYIDANGELFHVRVVSNPAVSSISVPYTSNCHCTNINNTIASIQSDNVADGTTVYFSVRANYSNGSYIDMDYSYTAIDLDIVFTHTHISYDLYGNMVSHHYVTEDGSFEDEVVVETDSLLMTTKGAWATQLSPYVNYSNTNPNAPLVFNSQSYGMEVTDFDMISNQTLGRVVYQDGEEGYGQWYVIVTQMFHGIGKEFSIPVACYK